MMTARWGGLILLVLGVFLLYFGWQSTGATTEQVSQTLTGRFTDDTMWFLVGGAVVAVSGAFLLFFRR
jgi:LPXTG-motif cell wall-anchored protein